MKVRRASIVSFLGLVGVVASVALAGSPPVNRECLKGSSCPGTVSCQSDVAWCCCLATPTGAAVCMCALGADCGLKSNWPAGQSVCFDP